VITFGFTRGPLTWWALARRTAEEFVHDGGPALAAQLAYYFFFALFPTILVGLALASFFPLEHFVDRMAAAMSGVVPQEVIGIIGDQIVKISQGQNGGLLTFGLLVAIWSSSAAMMGLIDALNRAYDIEEGRPWWRVRLLAIGLTIALTAFTLIAFSLVLVGSTAAEYVARVTGLGAVFAWTWKILQWPLVLVLIATAIALVFYFAPDAEQAWVWITPGSVLATVLWLVASLGFKAYVASFGKHTATYGAIGGVMVLLLWFYLSGAILVAGAEFNAEIEHASPYGKARGEKVPGRKRAIGALAYRRHAEGEAGPSPAPARPALPAAEPARSEGALRRVFVAAVAALLIFRSGQR
jgi:membrane protein